VDIRALAFDIFGTVVDWRSSIIDAVHAALPEVDAETFADRWRGMYQPAMEQVRNGSRPWIKLDALHRESLDSLLHTHGGAALDEPSRANLNLAWHRLDPWPDAGAGLVRLRRRFVLATLSNGNVSLLADLVNHGALPFDCILSAELAKDYKPKPIVYERACELLDLPPKQVMMVAAHPDDLDAAAAVGMATAFVSRPDEWGPAATFNPPPADRFDLQASDLVELAQKLGL
jgi:2-haloacid dehalogenase